MAISMIERSPEMSRKDSHKPFIQERKSPLGFIWNWFQAESLSLEEKIAQRDYRVIVDPQIVEKKLEKRWKKAQEQMQSEKDNTKFIYQDVHSQSFFIKAMKYAFANEPNLHVEKEKVGNHEVAACHCIGRRKEMEDEHIVSSFSLSLPDTSVSYPVELFGIFDGHGGSKASLYMKKNLEKKLQKNLQKYNSKSLSNVGIWNALKITMVELSDDFKQLGFGDGTTATVAMIIDGKLWTANVGDSRTILQDAEKGTVQLSEDASPEMDEYRKRIEKRGGEVFNVWGVHRINGKLAVGGAIGDGKVQGVCSRPKITMIPLSKIKKGSHLILACDGIYDVASSRQVGGAVSSHSKDTAEALAENIVHAAYNAGSGDNLSALVVKLAL